MIVTERNKIFILEAMKVDFLKEPWEVESYAAALMKAADWSKKVDADNRKYYSDHRLADKYNLK